LGIDVSDDMWNQLRGLSAEQAAKLLAMQRAEADAERMRIEKILRRKQKYVITHIHPFLSCYVFVSSD
jgi:hypothetical protein